MFPKQGRTMNTDTDSSDDSSAKASPESQDVDAGLSRSQQNLRQWREYLPEDCIQMMRKMGWDRTT
jgi:hypothetical protein